jgi:agmatinase
MLKLPVRSCTKDLDCCFVGVPLDCGTWNRPGTRFGPRQIRAESATITGGYNLSTGAAPLESLRVADVGDVKLNPHRIDVACTDIRTGFEYLIKSGCRTLALGGDHFMTYPILQAYSEKYGPVGMIHIDAHSDVWDVSGGCVDEKLFHGSPFRRAVEDGCLDPKRVVQIGLRGFIEGPDHFDWPRQQGFWQILASDCYYKSLVPLMAEVRAHMGEGPVYLTFDIDGIDPGFAPGTGTPEIGGLTPIQALEIIRGCRGLDIIGCDVVEVSPPYDHSGTTALLAANLLLEMLCIMPGVRYYK